MAAINWKGGRGGNGAWETPGNWAGGVVPTLGNDVAIFNSGGTYTVTATAGAAFDLVVQGDNVTLDGQYALYGTLTLPGGGVARYGGTLAVLGGGHLTLDAATVDTGFLAMDPGTSLDLHGTLTDDGAMADQVRVDGLNAHWQTPGGTAYVNQLRIANGGTVTGQLALDNNGTITLDPTATLGGAGDTLTVLGNGTLSASSPGIAGVTTVAETIVMASATGVLEVGANPWTSLDIAGPVEGGALVVDSGFVSLTGNNNAQAATFVSNATLQVASSGSVGHHAIWLSNGTLQAGTSLDGVTVLAQAGTDWISGGGGMVVRALTGATLNYAGGRAGSVVIGQQGATSGTLTITGGAGNDTIYAGHDAAVNYTGASGDAAVYGGTGVLHATGGSGHDTIYAGFSGHDVLQTGSGATTLGGSTAGGTLIATGPADNLLAAGGGNTTLNGALATGDNLFFGAHTGNTTIEGGNGHDTIVGTGGADTVFGGHGTENIFAGSGHLQLDFFDGYAGGTACVEGFDVAHDVIRLTNYAGGAVQQAVASEHIVGGNTILTLPDNTTLIFWNTVGITAHDFVT